MSSRKLCFSSSEVASSAVTRSKSWVLSASFSLRSRPSASAARSCSWVSAKVASQALSASEVSWHLASKCLRRSVKLSTSTISAATLSAPFSVTSDSNRKFAVSSRCMRSRNSAVNGSTISPSASRGPHSLSSAHRFFASSSWSSRIAFSACSRSWPSSASRARDSAERCTPSLSLHNNSKSCTFDFQASSCWPTPFSWPNSCSNVSRSPVTVETFSLAPCNAALNSPTSSKRWLHRSSRALNVACSCSFARRISSSAVTSCNSSLACWPARTCWDNSLISSSFFCNCFSNCQLRSKVSNSPSSTRALRRPSVRLRSICSAKAATRARSRSFSATRARVEPVGPSAPSPSRCAGVASAASDPAPCERRLASEVEEGGVQDILR
mmetsp:Transcript_81675/g.236774  ORF Transcript_81675/g.236774 Transcript_81675/m.236774 type:complete len:383 (+) Transcript_81675:366-1514(+)